MKGGREEGKKVGRKETMEGGRKGGREEGRSMFVCNTVCFCKTEQASVALLKVC